MTIDFRQPEPPRFDTAARRRIASSWVPPWTLGQPLERCVGHKFQPSESPAAAGSYGAIRRSVKEWTEGPLVVASTMRDGQCRGCYEGPKKTPAVAEVRERESEALAEPPPQLFEDTEPEAEAERSDFRTEPRRGWVR